MKIIEWYLETGMVGGDRNGEIEFEDDATDEEIEEAVKDEVFNFISWGWGVKETK